VLAIMLAAPHPAGAATGCGTFNADGAPVHAKVIRGATTCARARAVLRRYLISNAPCSGSACVRFVRGCASRHRRIRCLPAARELQPGQDHDRGLLDRRLRPMCPRGHEARIRAPLPRRPRAEAELAPSLRPRASPKAPCGVAARARAAIGVRDTRYAEPDRGIC
jgi:hypothetical protein